MKFSSSKKLYINLVSLQPFLELILSQSLEREKHAFRILYQITLTVSIPSTFLIHGSQNFSFSPNQIQMEHSEQIY